MCDVKICQACYEVQHPKSQYACDKCQALMDVHNGLDVVIRAIKTIEEKWVNK